MDKLLECASAFKSLMGCQYTFTLGRKGQLKQIILGFSATDFHHLLGLHKLKDISIARANRDYVFRDILSGRITYHTLKKSIYLHHIQNRIDIFPTLESLLDSNQLIFRYNHKRYPHSAIEGDFLLKMVDGITLNIAFLFLDEAEQGLYFCRSFFPFDKTDYTKGQAQFTLLRKEKLCLSSGEITLQYNRLPFTSSPSRIS